VARHSLTISYYNLKTKLRTKFW